MYIHLALDTLGNNDRCVEEWVQRWNRAVNCARHPSEMVSLSEGNQLEVIVGTAYEKAGEGCGEIQMKKITFLEFFWSWSDSLSQQYSKMSLIISPMTWTPSNQFEVAGWAIGTILKKTCFLSRRGWHLWIIKFAKIPNYLGCCWDPHTFFLPTHFSTELKGLRKLPLLYIYQYWGRAL